jgi:hypothetical protein
MRGEKLIKMARAAAREIAHANLPTGTRPHDDVQLTRAGLESLLVLAYAMGAQSEREDA